VFAPLLVKGEYLVIIPLPLVIDEYPVIILLPLVNVENLVIFLLPPIIDKNLVINLHLILDEFQDIVHLLSFKCFTLQPLVHFISLIIPIYQLRSSLVLT